MYRQGITSEHFSIHKVTYTMLPDRSCSHFTVTSQNVVFVALLHLAQCTFLYLKKLLRKWQYFTLMAILK